MPTDDNDRMTPAPVGSKVGRELALSDTGVVMPSQSRISAISARFSAPRLACGGWHPVAAPWWR